MENAGDYYWGCGTDGSGQNKLGKVLMVVRSIVRERAEPGAGADQAGK
ncbi:MAG: hypothetical protein ACJ8FY_14410 [Gemmataceae bacterium]